MRTEREPLLAALTGFFLGVFTTLAVIEFESSWISRIVILVMLAMLAAAAFAAFLFIKRQRAGGDAPASQGAWKHADASAPEPVSGVAGGPAARPPAPKSTPEWHNPRAEPQRDTTPPGPRGPRSVHHTETPPSSPSRTTGPAAMMGNSSPRRRENDSVYYPEEESFATEPSSTPTISYISADPNRLVEVWESYRKKGDGRFNVSGLRQRLEAAGIAAEVVAGEHVGAGDCLLAIDFRGGGPLYLLPNFNKPARTVSQWFQALGSESRTAVIQRLIRPATARRSGGGLTVETKGEIE